MYITATELKANLGKYLSLVSKEDILVTKNGKAVAKLIKTDTVSITDSLIGIIPTNNTDLDAFKSERLARHENFN